MLRLLFCKLFIVFSFTRLSTSSVIGNRYSQIENLMAGTEEEGLFEIGRQPEGVSRLCMQAYVLPFSSFKIYPPNGIITVYCRWNKRSVYEMISTTFVATGHIQTEPQLAGTKNKSLAYLRRDSFVSICVLECQNGAPYPRFKPFSTVNAEEPFALNIGCDDMTNMRCSEMCPPISTDVSNGEVTCTEGKFDGSVCQVHCNPGYGARGDVQKVCRGATSSWSPNTPFVCEASPTSFHCPALPQLANGEIQCTADVTAYLLCTATCRSGYSTVGPTTFFCFSAGYNSSWYTYENSMFVKLTSEVSLSCQESSTQNRNPDFEAANFDQNGTNAELKRFRICSVPNANRVQCRIGDVTKENCIRNGCCWRSTNEGAFSCYRPHQHRINAAGKLPTRSGPHRSRGTPTRHHSRTSQTSISAVFLADAAETYVAPRQNSLGVLVHGLTGSPITPCGCKRRTSRNVSECGRSGYTDVTSILEESGDAPAPRISNPLCPSSTTAQRWPWQVVLEDDCEICGGTLVSPQYVITAAHCFFSDNGTKNASLPRYAGFGATNISDNSSPHLQIRTILRIIRHPNFTSLGKGYAKHDIAIIKLDAPITETEYVRPLCLPEFYEPSQSDECYATGFGQQYESNLGFAKILQAVRLPITSREDCQPYYTQLKIDNSFICAGGSSSGPADTCKGDSGGPLACRRRDARGSCHWYLAGITSFGESTCGQGIPSVYTNVHHYQRWIRQTIYHLINIPN